MNNASFHLSSQAIPGRHHPLLMMPNHSSPNSAVRHMLSAADSPSSFAMSMQQQHNAGSPPTSQISALNFSQRDLLQFGQMNPGFPYLNSFTGLPMMPMGFGLFPQHHGLFSKSPGMMSSMPGFFNNFSMNKEEDLSWHKRSPNGFPDSPRSGSRSSPMDGLQSRKKLPKGRAHSEQNVCPICGQTVSGKSLQEHFLDELKTYRQEPLSARDVSSSSPTASTIAGRHSQSSTPANAGEADSRHEIYLRVRANRRARYGAPSSGDFQASSSRHPSSSTTEQRLAHTQAHQPHRPAALRHVDPPSPKECETELVVDVEADDEDESSSSKETPPTASRRASSKSPSGQLPSSRKRSIGETTEECEQLTFRGDNIRHRSCSTESSTD